MEAVVLVGGQGTRLRPLTLSTPKPMLPVAGVPFLTHQLTRLAAAGVDHVVLATSYRAETFAGHFGDGSALGLRLDFATETEPLGTGGGIRNVAPLLESAPDEPVLILNGDVLSGHDMRAQVALHREREAAVTLHLVEVADPRAFGCVPTDAGGRVTAFLEKSPDPPTNRINAGCYVFRRAEIDAIPSGEVVSVERDTFPGLLRSGAVVLGYVDPAYWLDVGTPRALVRGSADVVLGKVPGAFTAEPRQAVDGAFVDVDASIDGAHVGDGSSLGPGTVIEAGAEIRGSIVMAGARVGPGSVVVDSVVSAGADIGADCHLRDAVVGDRAIVGAGNELAAGARLWAGATLGEGALRF
jgi:mannose-1-phosphate guanylyltransferase